MNWHYSDILFPQDFCDRLYNLTTSDVAKYRIKTDSTGQIQVACFTRNLNTFLQVNIRNRNCALFSSTWVHSRCFVGLNKFSYFLNLHAMNVLLYRIKPRKHIHVKYCWQTYFKSIETLSQTFKNHIHNNIVMVACKWCVPSASDVFLSKNDNSGVKTREASEGVEYIYFMEYDCCPVWSRVLIVTHCPINLFYLW